MRAVLIIKPRKLLTLGELKQGNVCVFEKSFTDMGANAQVYMKLSTTNKNTDEIQMASLFDGSVTGMPPSSEVIPAIPVNKIEFYLEGDTRDE